MHRRDGADGILISDLRKKATDELKKAQPDVDRDTLYKQILRATNLLSEDRVLVIDEKGRAYFSD